MAKFLPELHNIRKESLRNTEVIKLINILKDKLDDSYNVYLEPFLNGDTPNIVIMNSKGNIYIIEIAEIDITKFNFKYSYAKFGDFVCKQTSIISVNPFKEVTKYKNDIFGFHIEKLFMQKEKNPKIYGIVKTAVYFPNHSDKYLNEYFKYKPYDVSFIDIVGEDSDIIKNIKYFCNKPNHFMTQDLFNEFHRLFKPSFHDFNIGTNVSLTTKQKEAVISKPNNHRKISGLAGSGKTLVLAHRAVQCTKRNNGNGKILILTYNITLINYIKDRINAVREDFYWNSFVIKHYHGFITEQAIKHNIKISMDKINTDENLYHEFKNISDLITKYDAILIDEGQDFYKHWFDILRDNFLKPSGEFIILGDEKQNIYNRTLGDDKKTSTNISGRWYELNTSSFRLGYDIVELANKFQIEYLKDKYDFDEIKKLEQFTFSTQDLLYKYDEELSYSQIFDEALIYVLSNNISNNNISIISNKIEDIRELEYYARKKYNLLIERTFETKEEYDELSAKYTSLRKLELKLNKLRRIRKFNFILNSGKMKMSTIHSFKGWETDTLILIIDEDEENDFFSDELLYTALTRCINNLIIFNRGNQKFHNFLNTNMNIFTIPNQTFKLINSN